MRNDEADEGLAAQNHEKKSWAQRDVALVAISLIMLAVVAFVVVCSCFPRLGGRGYLPGF